MWKKKVSSYISHWRGIRCIHIKLAVSITLTFSLWKLYLLSSSLLTSSLAALWEKYYLQSWFFFVPSGPQELASHQWSRSSGVCGWGYEMVPPNRHFRYKSYILQWHMSDNRAVHSFLSEKKEGMLEYTHTKNRPRNRESSQAWETIGAWAVSWGANAAYSNSDISSSCSSSST